MQSGRRRKKPFFLNSFPLSLSVSLFFSPLLFFGPEMKAKGRMTEDERFEKGNDRVEKGRENAVLKPRSFSRPYLPLNPCEIDHRLWLILSSGGRPSGEDTIPYFFHICVLLSHLPFSFFVMFSEVGLCAPPPISLLKDLGRRNTVRQTVVFTG